MFFLVLVLLGIYCEVQKIPKDQIQPIILVPGLGASGLEVTLRDSEEPHWWCKHSGKFWIWMNIDDLVPYLSVPCFLHNLQLHFNYSSNYTYNNKGINIAGVDYGGTPGAEYLNPILKGPSQVFYTFVKYFVKLGYERGKSIRGAPYDFRRTPQDWIRLGIFENLVKLVEDTYQVNGGKRVYLVGHSMGGPFTAYFLSHYVPSEWREKYVEAFISICGSYDGSFLSVPTMLYGKFYDFPVRINSIARQMGGLQWSIPRYNYQDDVFLVTDKRNYTSRQLDELFEDLGHPELNQILESVRQFDVRDPPGVVTHCFRGLGIKTPKVSYMKDLNSKFELIETMEGDGQVFPKSEGICDNWKGKQEEDVFSYSFKNGYDHRSIIQDPEVLDTVYKIIYGK